MRTPEQILGPYFPLQLKPTTDGDLTTIVGGSGRAQGEIIEIVGQIRNLEGEPVPAAKILIWQANCSGRYDHPNDRHPSAARSKLPRIRRNRIGQQRRLQTQNGQTRRLSGDRRVDASTARSFRSGWSI